MDAVVLVGGQGSRLRPLTLTTPKPMLPTAGVPFLEHLLARARDAGIDHVILSTSYKAEVFEGYFGDGSAFGLDLEYVTEDEPLGTGGGIRNVADRLRGGPVVIFNGDVLSGLDLRALLARHTDTGAAVTLHLTEVPDPRAFGVVPTAADGRVTAFLEKTNDPPTNHINAGCYVFEPEVLRNIPAGRVVSVERETFPQLLAQGALVQSYVDSTYWMDLGTPLAFWRGSSDLVRGVAPTPALPGPVGAALVMAGAQVDPEATLIGGTVVGAGCVVPAGCVLDSAVLFDGVTLGAGVEVRRSVLGRDVVIGDRTRIFDAVIGDGASIGAECELREGVRIWPGVVLPDHGLRFSPGL